MGAQYLRATCGFSRAKLTHLVDASPVQAFARRYSDADIVMLAQIERQFGTLSGPATVHLLRRAFALYEDARFERLAALSVSHLYNLRQTKRYAAQRIVHTKTLATVLNIGVRKAPAPEGRPGFIPIDSVHQGDQDGVRGVYHINAVDCVTQWQAVGCCERIGENFLMLNRPGIAGDSES